MALDLTHPDPLSSEEMPILLLTTPLILQQIYLTGRQSGFSSEEHTMLASL